MKIEEINLDELKHVHSFQCGYNIPKKCHRFYYRELSLFISFEDNKVKHVYYGNLLDESSGIWFMDNEIPEDFINNIFNLCVNIRCTEYDTNITEDIRNCFNMVKRKVKIENLINDLV